MGRYNSYSFWKNGIIRKNIFRFNVIYNNTLLINFYTIFNEIILHRKQKCKQYIIFFLNLESLKILDLNKLEMMVLQLYAKE